MTENCSEARKFLSFEKKLLYFFQTTSTNMDIWMKLKLCSVKKEVGRGIISFVTK